MRPLPEELGDVPVAEGTIILSVHVVLMGSILRTGRGKFTRRTMRAGLLAGTTYTLGTPCVILVL